LRNLAAEIRQLDVDLLPAANLAVPLDASAIERPRGYTLERENDVAVVTLNGVAENEVYRLRFTN
jgi:hypothetical protein